MQLNQDAIEPFYLRCAMKILLIDELQARARALWRRGEVGRFPILAIGLLQLNSSRCEVTYDGKAIALPHATPPAASPQLAQVLLTLRQQVFTAADGDRFQANCRAAIAHFPIKGQTLRSLYQIASSRLTRHQ